jgi:hypothetical protein
VFHEEVERLSGDLDIADQDDVGDVDEPSADEQLLITAFDGETFCGFADASALFLDVEWCGVIAGGEETPDVGAADGR